MTFPQEREFQNMFTFSPGFEAATLKIPNKEYTAMIRAPGAPRKQIIGFAKFRTREEALSARDVLQGRRVDIERGAVLKAEMAKKNLHTKRVCADWVRAGTVPAVYEHAFLASPASSSSGAGTGSGSGSAAAGARAVDQNPPINTLYVGNLPVLPAPGGGAGLGLTMEHLEGVLRELFGTCAGFRQMSFRPKGNGPMCFVEFDDVGYATKTLNELYGHTLGGLIKGGGIRLSYSKNPLGVRTPTSASGGGPLLQQQQQAQLQQAEAAFHPRLTSPPPPQPQQEAYAAYTHPAPRFFAAAPEGAWGRRWETGVPRAVGVNGAGAAFSPFSHSPVPPEPAAEGEAQ
ncbi:hypothetical protein DFH07DRAFT_734821 [Mycena maculata]|uniref:RRM domain-containing protein n=1 Tax=Mycena maculata TaxID=230809 RepID=A0AAD7JSS5_9AGAR|nr:hypothetical protein DFH07DRAFT_734821 [Mycena maculata]